MKRFWSRALAAMAGTLILSGLLVSGLADPAGASYAGVGPVDPSTGFPAWYGDSSGLRLDLCLDGPPNCLASQTDLVGSAPNGEAFYWYAQADVISPLNGSTVELRLALEAAFGGGVGAPCAVGSCDEIVFSRIRFFAPKPGALVPGASYIVTHPFGTESYTARSDGTVARSQGTQDTGCLAGNFPTPCDFASALSAKSGPFLRWDPAVAPAAPRGTIGDAVTPHPVVGSPMGRNFFTVEGPGLPDGGLRTDLFIVQGKVAHGPRVEAWPSAVNLGSVKVGETSPSSSVEVRNIGTESAILTGIGISGTDAREFVVTLDSCAPPIALGVDGRCTLGIALQPSSRGSKQAFLTVVTDSSGVQSLSVTGMGAAPTVAFSPTAMNLGDQKVGTRGDAHLLVVTNTGSDALRVSAIRLQPEQLEFVVDFESCTSAPVDVGAVCEVSLRFNPTLQGARSATLVVIDDAPVEESEQNIAVTGRGTVPVVSVTPTSLSFGSQPMLTYSAPREVVVRNIGDAELDIAALTVTGSSHDEFVITADACSGAIVAPGGNCAVTVQFRPMMLFGRTADIVITDDAPRSPRRVNMAGNGTLPIIGNAES